MFRNLLITVALAALILPASLPAQEETALPWYEFQPTNSPEPGEIGMQDWLHRPAGKFGRIEMKDEFLVLDGKAIKLWGLNNTYADCAPPNDLAEKRAGFYAKYGLNALRLHKYANGSGWRGITTPESFIRFDPEKLDRMDYFIAQLKDHGVYTKLSPSFGVRLGPDDRRYLPEYYDELTDNGAKPWPRVPYGAVYLLPEMQQVVIDQMLAILDHENPYTETTYAEEPAVSVIEIINEDSALWFGTGSALQKSPYLRQRASEYFSNWLRQRYGDHEGLVEAWGEEAINGFASEGFEGEHLDKDNIAPFGNPWFYDPTQLEGTHKHLKKRLLDTMLFLYQQQNGFYSRFTRMVRQHGYEGPIVGSNWQAGRMYSHFYNLHSDYLTGIIDRHNYFGGGKNPFNDSSMLSTAGSGMLSAGMQQVADRPFMLSEWIHVWPSEWGAEGVAIIGAYGMGLQGWDVSYMFQNRDTGGFSPVLGGHNWDVTAPQIFGLFPAVSRQVLRGDVKESDVVAQRYVNLPSLEKGELDFEEMTTQRHDIKTFDGDKVPAKTLAVARTVIRFTDEPKETPAFDLKPYVDGNTITSSTGQLKWTESDSPIGGYFTIDTPETQAFIGFGEDKEIRLSRARFSLEAKFCAIYVTAQGQDETLETADKILVVAMARARNSGQEIDEPAKELILKGEAPILMEPVRATIELFRGGEPTVTLLDHDGLRTDKTIPFLERVVKLSGESDKTPYYLIEYETD